MVMNNWIYQNTEFFEVPKDAIGFVYLITRIDTGHKYIGKKNLFSTTHKRVNLRRIKIVKSSDWKTYWSSSEVVKALVKELGEDCFEREILSFYNTKGELSYAEVKEQFLRDVLTSPDYLNKNIANRWFKKAPVTIENFLEA